jgi:hypothetical protein
VYAVGERHFMEIDNEPDRDAQELHIAQELRLVDWHNPLDGLDLNQDGAVDQHIEAQRVFPRKALVLNADGLLAGE